MRKIHLHTSNEASCYKEGSVLQRVPGWEWGLVAYYSYLMVVIVMMVMVMIMQQLHTGVIIVRVVTLRRKTNVIG